MNDVIGSSDCSCEQVMQSVSGSPVQCVFWTLFWKTQTILIVFNGACTNWRAALQLNQSVQTWPFTERLWQLPLTESWAGRKTSFPVVQLPKSPFKQRKWCDEKLSTKFCMWQTSEQPPHSLTKWLSSLLTSQQLAAALVSLEMFIPRSLRKCWHIPPTPVGVTWVNNMLFSRSSSFRLRKCWTTFLQLLVKQEDVRQLQCQRLFYFWGLWSLSLADVPPICHTAKGKGTPWSDRSCVSTCALWDREQLVAFRQN